MSENELIVCRQTIAWFPKIAFLGFCAISQNLWNMAHPPTLIVCRPQNFLDFGYPSHYAEEKVFRYPTPIDSFTGKPNERDLNEFGFKGKFENNTNYLSIAFFGGSTGYGGNPTILEAISEKLKKKGFDNISINFSSVSSNHNAHLHRLVEFSQFNYDLIIKYFKIYYSILFNK